MENWIKIGYAEDVDRRVRELSGTAVPLPYEVYCTYEIPRLQGVKDPDKLLHDLIAKLNPDLRISANREFFVMYPWDAYEMLFAIAQMHGRAEKLVRNSQNTVGEDEIEETEYTIGALFPDYNVPDSLYDRLKKVVLSIDDTLFDLPRKAYVSYKMGKRSLISLWPRDGWMEVVLNAKLDTLNDKYDMIYDISNRKWSSEQYAFKLYPNTDMDAVKNLITQVYNLKK
ncbi:MAG: GIY-YIG nuclease family protein [Lachnospiraceae bacterium]|nr:GIY-YIG nuclease family protein [Lachnospiraceae bacterium]